MACRRSPVRARLAPPHGTLASAGVPAFRGRHLRLVTWNCRIGGFRYKAEHIAPLRPDVLAVQEVEPLDAVLLFGGADQPTFRDRASHPQWPRRSIGVFSYTDAVLEAADAGDLMYEFRRYSVRRGDLAFQLVAVWTADTAVRADAYRQALAGLRRFGDWIRGAPTVVMGDFNDNASYRATHWPELLALTQPLGLVSAYHAFTGEEFGSESRPTHFHRGSAASPWHIDYCFVPEAWVPRITDVRVGDHLAWSRVSDHVPLIVDLDL